MVMHGLTNFKSNKTNCVVSYVFPISFCTCKHNGDGTAKKKIIAGFVSVPLKCELENFKTLFPGNIPSLNVCCFPCRNFQNYYFVKYSRCVSSANVVTAVLTET
jgi:hypothetical protein